MVKGQLKAKFSKRLAKSGRIVVKVETLQLKGKNIYSKRLAVSVGFTVQSLDGLQIFFLPPVFVLPSCKQYSIDKLEKVAKDYLNAKKAKILLKVAKQQIKLNVAKGQLKAKRSKNLTKATSTLQSKVAKAFFCWYYTVRVWRCLVLCLSSCFKFLFFYTNFILKKNPQT